tara:strand:- start:857 stop:1918 length:1062 start_codon:yes stop_codon:yes gene_type:complete
MEFFNKKEDVIDIQLTQYGKYLLSIGEFRPDGYAFFDDDVLYDVGHANFSEEQNKSASRIKMDTPRVKTQYVFSGIETQFQTLKGKIQNTSVPFTGPSNDWLDFGVVQQGPEKNYSLSLPIGESSLATKFAPAWNIGYINGKLTGSSEFITGSNFSNVRIPQLESDIKYKTYVTFFDEDEDGLVKDYIPRRFRNLEQAELDEDLDFIDRSTIQIEPDFLFVDVVEENTNFLKENFDIEVFMIEKAKDKEGNIVDKETQLYFGGTISGEEAETAEGFESEEEGTFTPEHVQYYFDIIVDGSIDPDLYCASKNRIERKNQFSDQLLPFRCEDDTTTKETNPYDINITDKDSEEIC